MITLHEPIICSDVDGTLVDFIKPGGVENHPRAIEVLCPDGSTITVVPNRKNIEYLREAKANGFKIVIWSWAGAEWSTNVVNALQLGDIVDMIMAKPEAYLDDLKVEEWLTNRIFLEDNEE